MFKGNKARRSFLVIDCIIALCKLFLCLFASELIYIKLITGVFSVPEHILLENYSVMGAIYTLPSLTILVILAIAMEFVTQKLKVKNEVKQNGEFN